MLDDRGREVEVMRRAGFAPWPLEGDARIAALISRMRMTLGAGWGPFRVLVIMAIAMPAALLMGFMFPRILSTFPGVPVWIPMLLFGVTIATSIRLFIRSQLRRRAGLIVNLALEEGLCGSCGYNLVGLPLEADQCLVCPECSAGWRAAGPGARLRTRAAFAPGSRMGDPWSVLGARRLRPAIRMRDDRGREVEGAPPRLRAALRAAEPLAERHTRLLRARAAILRDGRIIRWLIGLLLLVLVIGVPIILASLASPGSAWWAPLLGIFPATIPITIMFIRGRIGFRARAVRAALLAESLCPSCTAELRSSMRQSDGLVECSVCRSAWAEGGRTPVVAPLEAGTMPSA